MYVYVWYISVCISMYVYVWYFVRIFHKYSGPSHYFMIFLQVGWLHVWLK